MQIQSTVTISNAYTKKKKNSKRVVNSLALLTNEAFQVMHMLQLHILCVLHWLGLLEPALYLVCMRLPGAPSSQEDLAISAGWIPKTYPHLVNKKKGGTVLSGPEANYANLYIYVHTIFSLRLELLYSYTVCRKLSEICYMLNFHLCSFPSRLLYQKDT